MTSRIQIPVWEEYKMQFGAMASLNKNTLNIEVDYDVKNLEKVIYMFVFDSEIVRIGSSKAKFYQRMRRYELDITKSLNNKKVLLQTGKHNYGNNILINLKLVKSMFEKEL